MRWTSGESMAVVAVRKHDSCPDLSNYHVTITQPLLRPPPQPHALQPSHPPSSSVHRLLLSLSPPIPLPLSFSLSQYLLLVERHMFSFDGLSAHILVTPPHDTDHSGRQRTANCSPERERKKKPKKAPTIAKPGLGLIQPSD